MTRDEPHEELLWEMSRSDEIEGTAGPDDETLRAWREGELDEAEARAVEAALAASPETRERLAARAGVEAEAPPPALRRRTLERFGPSRDAGGQRWWKPVVALAASLVVALGLLQLFRTGDPEPLPGDLAFDVAVSGLADTRGTGTPAAGMETDAAAPPVAAHPETRLRFAVMPRGSAVADLDFGLYRLLPAAAPSGEEVGRGDGNRRLERVADSDPAGGRATFRVDRGAATLSAPASELVGPLIGSKSARHTLYVVVARRGDLPPDRLEVAEGEPAALLATDGRRLVYTRPIELLSPGSDARDADGPEG